MARGKVLTTGLAKSTEQVDSAIDKVLELSEDLTVDHRTMRVTRFDWFVHVEAGEDLLVFEEEVVSLSRDLCVRNVTGEDVLQPLNPGGEVLDVFIQPVGFKTVDDLVTEHIEVDGFPPQVRDGDVTIDTGVGIKPREYHGGPLGNIDIDLGARARNEVIPLRDFDRLNWQGNLDWADTWVDG